jgi:hypothetical protein
MSDTDVSVEATVAGEAASAAVEEVHAREEVVETAQSAAVEALEAVIVASEAEQSAQAAESTAAVAVEVAATAQESAEQAQQQTEAVAWATQEAFAAHQSSTDEKLREMREYIDSRVPLPTPEQTQPEYTEVEATAHGIGTDVSNSGTGEAGSSGEESNGAAQGGFEKQYGLRHRRKR